MAKHEVFILKNDKGKYEIRIPGSYKASAVLPGQKEAIALARRNYPESRILVECELKPDIGGRNRWMDAPRAG